MFVESPSKILSTLRRDKHSVQAFPKTNFLESFPKKYIYKSLGDILPGVPGIRGCSRTTPEPTAYFFPLNKLIRTVTNMHINTQPLQTDFDKVCCCVFYSVSLVWEEEGLNVTEHKYSAALTNLFGLPEATDVSENARSADKKMSEC